MLLALLIVANADPGASVVFIEQGGSSCAGTVIDAEGTVLTAYHCVMNGGRPRLTSRDGQRTRGRVRAVDRRRDLALVDGGPEVEPLMLSGASIPEPGSRITVWGHPRGSVPPGGFYTGLLRWTISDGVIAGVGPEAIQITAPINPGNSGGPVLNEAGEVIGVVSRKMNGDGMGFAGRVTTLPTRRLGPLGGRLAAYTFLQSNDSGIFSLGARGAVEFRDRLVVQGSGAFPLGLRWRALERGEASHVPWRGRIALRQRLFHGPFTVRLDVGAGLLQLNTLERVAERFRTSSTVRGAVGAQVQFRGLFLDATFYGTTLQQSLLTVGVAFPGTLGKL